MELVFLGTGAGSGIPAFYCRCKVCTEARNDSRCKRTRSAVMLDGKEKILLDAPPELTEQLSRTGVERIDKLLFTHWHYDHIGGLGDIELYVRLQRKKPLPAFMSQETRDQIQIIDTSLRDYLELQILEVGQAIRFEEVCITALEATHTPGTLGFLIEHGRELTAYFPDTGPLTAKTKRQLQGIDCLILDTTFFGSNWYPDEHLSFDQTIALGRELEVKRLYLTHLSMHYDIPTTSQELEEKLKQYNHKIKLSYDSLRIPMIEN
jgi:phosphoribosyl 1,2-cyclic phosphate phosphodiesterase